MIKAVADATGGTAIMLINKSRLYAWIQLVLNLEDKFEAELVIGSSKFKDP